MKARWQALSARDRRILAVGAVLAAALLGWAWIWDPLTVSRATLRAQAEANEATLAWMRPLVDRVAAAGGVSVRPADGRSLLARVDAGARAAGLGAQLAQVEPLGTSRVRLQFTAVEFDALVAWLESLPAEGIRIEELAASRAAGSGRVDARVALAGQGP